MSNVLVFTLAAPMAAFGEFSGTKRSTQRTPTFSSIVGLLGAALGLARGDPALAQLANDYAMAVRIERDGGVLTDFHTVETPHSTPKRGFHTRRDELAGNTGVMITRRDYRQDVEYTIALFSLTEDPEIDVRSLALALQKPRYALYAGRRSCQLSQPPNPREVEAITVSEVLGTQQIVYDGRLNPGDCKPHHAIERHDLLVGPRQFRRRTEYVV